MTTEGRPTLSFFHGQLSDSQATTWKIHWRESSAAVVEISNALESKNFVLRREDQASKSWKSRWDTETGIYLDKCSESEVSNLIPHYIWAIISNLFPFFNYLISYCRAGSALSVSGLDGTWRETCYWRRYYATEMTKIWRRKEKVVWIDH